MSITPVWTNLRDWRGSQAGGFEELCCQLAACEPAPAGAEYRRVGTPDAGVECIWRDPSGSVRAWQAKFFLTPPTANQWQQIDQSVDQAMRRYPDLAEYTVCLPLDRPDPRIAGQQSMMDRWNTHVEKWKATGLARGHTVAFHYWGEHEIGERLAREEHAGRAYFWFSTSVLTATWFREHFRVARENAGPRYSPELNVGGPISDVFDALSRHPRFTERLRRQWGKARREITRTLPARGDLSAREPSSGEEPLPEQLRAATDRIRTEASRVRVSLEVVGARVAHLDARPSDVLPLAEIEKTVSDLEDTLRALSAAFDAFRDAALAISAKVTRSTSEVAPRPGAPQTDPREPQRRYEYQRQAIWRATSELGDLRALLGDAGALVANRPALLLTGDAGTGKTHLLCDVARRTIDDDAPCVILLGEQFTQGDPWPQIIQQLHLDVQTPDLLLGALSAAGEAAGRRALVLIDALNEGEGRQVWHHQLPGVLATIERYPWIGIALSVRSSYEPLIIAQSLRGRLTTVEHRGFTDLEGEATRRFFDAYGIERPSVPRLTPEFSNPLFLKLFCQGMRNRGLSRIPAGLEGISAIFRFFLESVQERLAAPDRLDFDVKTPIVERAVSALATDMVETGSQWVTRERAAQLLGAVLPRDGFERSLLRALLSEGVLSEELRSDRRDSPVEAVRFTYERLADHRIASLLLDATIRDDGTLIPPPSTSSIPTDASGPPRLDLPTIFATPQWQWYYQGIVNALAIQVPERTGRELWEIWPTAFGSVVVWEAFLDSLQWRHPRAIGDAALHLVNRHVMSRTNTGDRLRDLLMGVAAQPLHPLNAAFLDRLLAPLAMPERDEWWSTYVAFQDDDQTAVGRLIDWAWTTGHESHLASESVELVAVALAWTLATSNRRVRDHATKALVSLLHSRPTILRGLLERFSSVDDLYVIERLYAVAYGCVLRGIPRPDLEGLAREVFARVFNAGSPRPHLLLRDYARGVVEAAASAGLVNDVNLQLVRPPYRSDPPGSAPSEAELRARYYTPYRAGKEDGYFALWFSLMSSGDFARYIVGTNSHSFSWTARPLADTSVLAPRRRYERFFDGLSDTARRRWYDIRRVLSLNSLAPKRTRLGPARLKRWRKQAEAAFRASLPPPKRQEFDTVKVWGDEPLEPYQFDHEYALRWLFQRVIDLGWTPERFGWFDRSDAYQGRMSHRRERIGKKYQWLAFHEFTARVADNFEFRGDPWAYDPEYYEGPWQLYCRDIDPSHLGRGGTDPSMDPGRAWHQSVPSPDWQGHIDDSAWIQFTKDLPHLGTLVAPHDPTDGAEWLWLRGDIDWREPEPPDEEVFEHPRRNIRYWITAFFVKSEDRDRLARWAAGRDIYSMRIHETISTQQVYLGEHPWAPAFRSQYADLISKPWRTIGPVRVVHPSVTLSWESNGYDNSVDHALSLSAPAPALLHPQIGDWGKPRSSARYTNPSLVEGVPDALLARRSALNELLKAASLELVWLMTGEKIVIGGPIGVASDTWPGRLEISGVGWFDSQAWREHLTIYLQHPNGERVKVTS